MVPTAPDAGAEVRDGWFQRVDADQLRRQGRRRRAQPRPHRRTPLTEPLGYGATYTWGGSAVGHDGKAVPVEGSFTTVDARTDRRRPVPARRRPDRRRRGADHPAVRRVDQRQGRGRAGAQRHHHTRPSRAAGPGCPTRRSGSRVHWRTREYYPAGTTVHVDAKLYGVPFGDGAFGAEDVTLTSPSAAARWSRPRRRRTSIQVVTDEGVIMDFAVQLRRGRPAAQRHPQRHPRGHREVRRLLHVQPRRRLHQRARALGGADLQQRRVHPRQPGQRVARRAIRTSPTAASTCRPENAERVLQHRDLRRPGRGHRHVDPAVLLRRRHLGLGGRTGTTGSRCRR